MLYKGHSLQIGHREVKSERIDTYHANSIDNWSGYTNTNQRFQYEENIEDKEGHYKMIEVPFHQEDLTILNVYAPENKTSKFMNQNLTELKGKY